MNNALLHGMMDIKLDQTSQVVSFMMADELYGLDILRVQEINRMPDITRVPNSAPAIDGVINLRGKVIPVVDLRSVFSLPRRAHDHRTRIIVVECKGREYGFVVDEVLKVLSIAHKDTEPAPALVANSRSEAIDFIGRLEHQLIMVLDIDALVENANPDETTATITENNYQLA